MKRVILIALALIITTGFVSAFWMLAGLPPAPMVWNHGFSYDPEPTGQRREYGGVEFVEIGPGCFLMGSNRGAEIGDWLGRLCADLGLPFGNHPKLNAQTPVHWVEFPNGFWIARTELTNEQYERFDRDWVRSEFSPGSRDPVIEVTWDNAKDYCAWLSEESGLPIRLPSEAEWECASRAGSRQTYCFGDDEKLLPEYAWYNANAGKQARPVGCRKPNQWDLCDFHGNVYEWCEDTFHPSYEGAPTDGSAWTEGGEAYLGTIYRVRRDGCWKFDELFCRSAYRSKCLPGIREPFGGFRPGFSLPRGVSPESYSAR